MPDHNLLKPFMNECFARSKAHLKRSDTIEISICILTVTAVFLPGKLESIAIILALISGTLKIAQKLFIHAHRKDFIKGEEIRRRLHLANSLDQPISENYLSELKKEYPRVVIENETYYDSDSKGGFERLLETTMESSFWTEHLQRKIATAYWWYAFLSTISFVIISSIVIYLATTQTRLVVSKAILGTLMLIIAIDLWGRWWNHFKAHLETKRIYESCYYKRKSGVFSDFDVILIFANYSSINLMSFPPSEKIYKSNKELLNKEWESVKKDL